MCPCYLEQCLAHYKTFNKCLLNEYLHSRNVCTVYYFPRVIPSVKFTDSLNKFMRWGLISKGDSNWLKFYICNLHWDSVGGRVVGVEGYTVVLHLMFLKCDFLENWQLLLLRKFSSIIFPKRFSKKKLTSIFDPKVHLNKEIHKGAIRTKFMFSEEWFWLHKIRDRYGKLDTVDRKLLC